MFCPACRTEYRPGFDTCGDCGAALVKELPPEPRPEPEEEHVDFVEILNSFNPADMAFIKSVLDAEGFTYYIKGENFSPILSWSSPQRLMVDRDQAQEVKDLLDEVELTFAATTGSREKD